MENFAKKQQEFKLYESVQKKKELLFVKLRHHGSKKKETIRKSYFRDSKDHKIERKIEKRKTKQFMRA